MPHTPDPRHFARAVTDLGEKRPVVTSSAIFNAHGMKILEQGVAVNARLYERLTQHQLQQSLDQSVAVETAIDGDMLRESARVLAAAEPLFGAMLDEDRLRERFFEELSLVPLPKAIAFQLTLMHETQPVQWQHALRSAITAAWLVARQDGTRYEIRLLAATGLLHDLGMLHLDPVLLQPEIELSGEQRRQLVSHPLVSATLLERHHEYPRELLRAVLEHHEAMDGSGYPRQLDGAQISPWGRILALAEVVTSMFAPERAAPGLRLSLVLRMNRHRLDAALVREVTRLLPILGTAGLPPLDDDPAQVLRATDALLASWPAATTQEAGSHAATVERIGELCGQVQRVLSSAGAAPAQLAQLGADGQDGALRAELTLVAREGVWQLRNVARQARQRWRLAAGEAYPAGVQQWLAEADALAAQHLSAQESESPA
jgi:HD-GYP domain-containing protein (c-di-GMP phosphodiesterase class II)